MSNAHTMRANTIRAHASSTDSFGTLTFSIESIDKER